MYNTIKSSKKLRTFYIFLMGQFVSQFGSKLTSYGLVLWAYKQSGSVLSASILSVCYLVPEIFLNFIAGSISDKWNKKKIMLTSDGVAAIGSISVLLLLQQDALQISYLYLINILLGIMDAFQNPASTVAETLLVSKEDYMKTSGLRSFCNSFVGIFSPLVATTLYSLLGLNILICLDLITFIFAFITLWRFVLIPDIVNYEHHQDSIWQNCRFGIQYLVKHKGILNLIGFMAFVNFIAAIYNTNLSPMILSRTGDNDLQLGIVTSTIGIAGLLGSILVTKTKPVQRKIRLCLYIMMFSFLICNSMLGIGRNFYVWTLAVLLGNLLIPFLMANTEYIMRTEVPITMQGRVFSARNTLQYACIPIGNLLGGILADDVFEPYMHSSSSTQNYLSILVGSGDGSGIALLYVVLGLVGFLGCCLFLINRSLNSLDKSL
ncbi:MAG: MFS transporter [Clostridiales bacterium]|nr:MFS transporter [uncultured Anaerosporobacter sp.]MBS5934590.1 MFS transporter [Clostridiales bacterium]